MLSAKENRLNFHRRKPMERFVNYFDNIQLFWQCSGFHERPPHHESGSDWFGVYWVWDPAEQAFIPDHKQKPLLDDICNWREIVKWPDLDAIDWNEAARIDGVDEADRENNVIILFLGNGPFERLHTLMGMEGALCAMMIEPEECKAFFEKWTEWKCKLIEYLCEYYKPEVISFHDDSGAGKAPFYSPDIWHDLIKPSWTACCQTIKKHGVLAELHTCGKNDIFLKEIEDCGFGTLMVQKVNDYKFVRKYTQGRVGFSINDITMDLEMKALTGGVTAKEVRDFVFNYCKCMLEDSPNGYDFIALIAPIPTTIPNAPDETMLKTPFEVVSCGWEWINVKNEELTEIMLKKQR